MGLAGVWQRLRAPLRAEELDAGGTQRRARVGVREVEFDAVVVARVNEEPDVVRARVVGEKIDEAVEAGAILVVVVGFVQEESERGSLRRTA